MKITHVLLLISGYAFVQSIIHNWSASLVLYSFGIGALAGMAAVFEDREEKKKE